MSFFNITHVRSVRNGRYAFGFVWFYVSEFQTEISADRHHFAVFIFFTVYALLSQRKRGSRVVSALASCAGGPGFDPRRRRGKFFVGPNHRRLKLH